MKRWHEEKKVMERRVKEDLSWRYQDHNQLNPLTGWNIVHWRGTGQGGRFRKKKPFDCGNPRCGICHSHKRFGHTETRQEYFADLKFKEQLDELE